jgi:ATP-dependent Clp protease ATP-binding subunit ClpB
MTSNLASDEIREAAPRLRALIDATIDRPEEYNRVVTEYNRDIHPILKGGFKRDEFLGRINQIVVFLPLSEEEVTYLVKSPWVTIEGVTLFPRSQSLSTTNFGNGKSERRLHTQSD